MIDFMKIKRGRTSLQDINKRLEDVAYVAIDTELTGLNEKKDSIVSIGAVRMCGGRVSLGDSYYRLINPETQLTAESVVIHEITPSEVSEKPYMRTVLTEFLNYCGNDVLVGFCVSIDMEFMQRATKRLMGRKIRNRVVDIKTLYEWMRHKCAAIKKEPVTLPDRYGLYDIAKYFDIPVSGSHNALIDAYVTAQIFQRFFPVFVQAGIMSVGDLLKLSDRLKGGDSNTVTGCMSNF
jgi:DNA polymerase-3 subunit epsilon